MDSAEVLSDHVAEGSEKNWLSTWTRATAGAFSHLMGSSLARIGFACRYGSAEPGRHEGAPAVPYRGTSRIGAGMRRTRIES